MRTIFIFVGVFFILLLFMTVKEPLENEMDPELQKGTINQLSINIANTGVTSSAIQVLQDKADKQQEQITRIESSLAMIEAK